MMRFGHLVIFSGIVLFWMLSACNGHVTPEVCFENNCYSVEIADTQEKRVEGLMHRESMASSWGMLFVFDAEENHSFWMKNTIIPLDIIWIDATGAVVHIEENTAPYSLQSLQPEHPAKYVLELNAGEVQLSQIRLGDQVSLPVNR